MFAAVYCQFLKPREPLSACITIERDDLPMSGSDPAFSPLQVEAAYEEVDEQRQIVAQQKRKVARLTGEANDLRIHLEEQTSRNTVLEKKQRKFDIDMHALQVSRGVVAGCCGGWVGAIASGGDRGGRGRQE